MATKTNKTETSGKVSEKVDAARTYLEEAKAEIKKVTWPTKAEVRVTTLAVLILVTIMSLFLGVVDFGLVTAVKHILALGM